MCCAYLHMLAQIMCVVQCAVLDSPEKVTNKTHAKYSEGDTPYAPRIVLVKSEQNRVIS
jgi:hypothetical protein